MDTSCANMHKMYFLVQMVLLYMVMQQLVAKGDTIFNQSLNSGVQTTPIYSCNDTNTPNSPPAKTIFLIPRQIAFLSSRKYAFTLSFWILMYYYTLLHFHGIYHSVLNFLFGIALVNHWWFSRVFLFILLSLKRLDIFRKYHCFCFFN